MKENNYQLCCEYVDDGFSGTSFERPAFKKMIKDIEQGKINMVITKDMSRLGWDYIESGYYVEKYFPEKRVRYIAINDGIDTFVDNASNDFLPFKAVINDLYAKDISKKIKASIITKKKQGLFLGATAPYGYKKDPKNKYKLIIDPVASEVVRTIFNMYIDGNSLQKISQKLTSEKISPPSVYKEIKRDTSSQTKNIWDPSTIDEILKNPNYTGNMTQNRRKKINYKSKKVVKTNPEEWIVVKDTHEPIIDKRTFELVQKLYSKNKNMSKSNSLLLRGFLICKECGHKLGINKSRDKKRHYTICNYYKKYSQYGFCTCHSMRYEYLEKIVLENIRELCNEINIDKWEDILNNYNYKNKSLDKMNEKIKIINSKVEKNKRYLEEMYFDKLSGIITVEMYQKFQKKILDETKYNNDLIEKFKIKEKVLLNNKSKNYQN